MRPPVSRRGISLIETLVAFAIVAVAMTVLGQLMFWAMNESAFSRRRAEATLLAQERMEDLLAHRSDLAAWEEATKKRFAFDEKGEAYGFDEPGRPRPDLSAFRWTWRIEDMKDHPGLKQVEIQLDWRRTGDMTAAGKRELWSTLAVPKSQATAAAEPNQLEGVTQ
jgi:type II secretory pathway pseudopilin PulG